MTDARGPLVPSPIAALMALILTGCIPLNIWLDYQSADYSGGQVNYLLTLLIGGIFGIDLTRRRRRGHDADDDEGFQ